MNYLPFDLEIAEKEPWRIVRLSDGATAIDCKVWTSLNRNKFIDVQWADGEIRPYHLLGNQLGTDAPAIGLMPERVEWYVYEYQDTLTNHIVRSTNYIESNLMTIMKTYRIAMNPDGSDPQIEVVK